MKSFTPTILALCCATATAFAEVPNIVLLISDDYENFGFMANPSVKTPALDSLAASGVT